METELMIRPMTVADVLQAQALTASFGWPHRREDWILMLGLGHGVVAEQGGRLVGTTLSWRYGADWATLGLIGVLAEAQGRGIGRRMVQALVQELADRHLALYATEAGTSLYSAVGFVPTGLVVQHQGIVSRLDSPPMPREPQLCSISLAELPVIAALDRAASGMDRCQLLAGLLEGARGVVLKRAGVAIGFALLRVFGRGKLIGPVVAPDGELAKAMIATLLSQHAGQFMRIDVPKESGLCAWLTSAGLTDAGTVIRMVRGPAMSAGRTPRAFALASQAFG